ncbi:Aste57867_23906 [Aphanomyces stellatus]|uniref:Aste57867_23906 protein n=1 Tax=Aphanomyces stellatus TaxID=120398 RepID=A0A485LQT5_9STRA|nr:hypothetical protein As57867_023833 [Aphanomyces stellatus]VFU00549.1 Aste57867_23906 [Aphanomyces stellatus]
MLRRGVLALTTHFRLPHEGMEAFEVLSRGSAILSKRADLSKSVHVLTCAHVACPWLYPSYYPHEWLQHVDESFVRHTLAWREVCSCPIIVAHFLLLVQAKTGALVWETDLEPHVSVHGLRDLALLELTDTQHADALHAFSLVEPLDVPEHAPLTFLGHTQPNETQILPQSVAGAFFWCNPSTKQAFASSDVVLEQGMCGGAAVANDGRDVVGLIEGIVPVVEGASPAYKSLENHVAFIPRDELTAFVNGTHPPADIFVTGLAA